MAHKNILTITALSAALALVGCGGGGSGGYHSGSGSNPPAGGGGSETPETPVTKTAELLAVGLSKSSLNAGGQDQVAITIRTLDKDGGIIPNAEVKIAIENASASGANLSTPTTVQSDDNGVINTELQLTNSNLAQRLNRNIKLTVKSGATTEQIIDIPVNGTAIVLSTDSALLEEGTQATVTLKAVDAVGTALQGATASLTGVDGKQIGTTQKTDTEGNAVFKINYATVLAAKNNTLELMGSVTDGATGAAALLTTESLKLTANVANNVITRISNNNAVAIGVAKEVAVQVVAATQAELVGKKVNFATTNGEVSVKSANITDIRQENGQWVGSAKTSITGAVAAVATISAQFGNNVIYLSQQIQPGVPKHITLQAESIVLAPGNNTKVIALVKDEKGSPVPNTVVSFKIEQDTSSTGRLSQPTAVTDSAGRATVVYHAGSAPTLAGQVIIGAYTANNASTPVPVYSEKLRITVAKESAYITIAQNHEIQTDPANDTFYFKNFSASVVDTAGNPIANQVISISVDGVEFRKGFYDWVRDFNYASTTVGDRYGIMRWARVYRFYDEVTGDINNVSTYLECPSREFPNPVTILNKNNQQLGTTSTFTTDAQGKFDFKIRYGKNYANWTRVELKASTTVSTKDNMTALSLELPVGADDVGTQNISRPDRVSPYGVDYSSCLNYN